MKNVLLSMQNVSFFVPGNDNPILNKINYEVFAGDFVIILGSNGSGKSTLLKLIDKRNFIKSGSLFLDGQDINKYSAKDYSQKVKTLTQNSNDSLFLSLTLFENYLLAQNKKSLISNNGRAHKNEREFLKDYLSLFNAKLCLKLDQIVDDLSGGEKQTFILALTILNPPLLLLLDEHTSALDPKTAEQNMQLTKEMVEKNKITCLLTTHNLGIAQQYGNRILAIRNGEIMTCIESKEKDKFTDKQMYQMFY